ncbi:MULTISPECIES: hypothetical protein [unclassified Actinotalea]|uniref:hypothetical protein n=1 Tax=unclassified Actinotalea TaxID=2638618 RepID=UPI0015F5F028|nr:MULTISPECIES: hypothetical protein [unclassified Actinotalea]
MVTEGWIEHRRAGDRELVGWLRPEGDGFVAVDRLGHDVTGVVDWQEGEEALEERGLHWLADLWQLTLGDGRTLRVAMVEVSPERVVVKLDDFGAVGVEMQTWTLPFPAPPTLRPFAGDRGLLDADWSPPTP